MYRPSTLASSNAGTDSPVYLDTTTIANGDYSVPFATGSRFSSVTVVIEPTNSAGKAVIQSRATNAAAWFDLTEVDLSDGVTKGERLVYPCGQIRVKNEGNAGITVSVQGLGNN